MASNVKVTVGCIMTLLAPVRKESLKGQKAKDLPLIGYVYLERRLARKYRVLSGQVCPVGTNWGVVIRGNNG